MGNVRSLALSWPRLRSPLMRFSCWPPWKTTVPLFRSPVLRMNVARSVAVRAYMPAQATSTTVEMTRRTIDASLFLCSQFDANMRARDTPTVGRSSLVLGRSSAAELEADADADLHALRAQAFDQNLVAAFRFGDVAVAITHVRKVPCSKVDRRPAPHHHERLVLRLAQIGAE